LPKNSCHPCHISEISVSYMHAFKNTVNGSVGSIPASYGGGFLRVYCTPVMAFAFCLACISKAYS